MASGVNFGTQQYFGFDPRTVPGCQLWLDAADSRTVTGTSPVTGWVDKTSNAYNFSNFTGTSTLTSNARGSLSAITFSGSSSLNNSTFSFPNTSNSIFVVAFQTASNATTYSRLLNGGGGASDAYLFMGTFSGTGNYATFTGNGSTWNDTASNTPASNITGLWTLMEMTVVSSVLTPYLNGTAQNTKTGTTGAFTGLNIGGSASGSIAQGWNGLCGEVIVYNSVLPTSQRQQVEGYLAWKWGLQANLPAGHPFKSNPTMMRIFQPIDIPDCCMWLDAADLNTITLQAGTSNLTGIQDKSPNGILYNDATTGPSGFTYQSSINAFQCSSNAANIRLVRNTTFPFGSNLGVFVVASSTFGYVYDAWSTSTRVQGFYVNGTTLFGLSGGVSATSANLVNVYSLYQYGTTTGVYRNGGSLSSGTMTAGSTARLTIANRDDQASGNNFQGNIYEVIAFNRALSTAERQQLEGYLAAKWSLSGSLPTTHPFYLQRALPSTPLFVPVNLSNLGLWLDAADRSTITFGAGSNISNWRDKASNYNLSQATSISQATYVENSLNGLPIVSITTNTGVSGTTFSPNGLTAMSMFAVVNNNANQAPATNANFQFLGWNETGSWGQVYFGAYTTFMEWRFGTGQAENKPFANFQSNVGASYNILSTSKSGTSEPAYRNGTLLSNYTAANTTISGTGSTTRIGLNSSGNNICEIIVYTRNLTNSERQQVEGYLAWKWGLRTNIPTTHPYYKFRP